VLLPRRAIRRIAPVATALTLAFATPAAGSARPPSPPSGLRASAVLLVDEASGAVLYARNADERLPIASTTKLMTAFAVEQTKRASDTLVEQPYRAGIGESLAPVPPGTRLSVADMLRAMLLPSGNNVAHSLAIDVGGSVAVFVAEMNSWAALLGMTRTHYSNPIGLDTPAGNRSTASDLATLTRALLADPLMRSIVDQPRARLAHGIVVPNLNDLIVRHPWVVGVKTGSTTDAGYCLVGAADLHGIRVISVVLGAPSKHVRDVDSLALLRYGLDVERRVEIAVRGRVYGTVAIRGRRRRVGLVAWHSSTLVVSRAVALHVSRVGVPRRLTGPLPAGRVEGAIQAYQHGRLIESIPLLTASAVPRPWPVARPVRAWPFILAGGAVTLILLLCSLIIMRRRARRADPGGIG
jgi:D-alanyl-D-alanine carboxypeptidase (penicillin-binding protein 5/6)